MTVLVGPNCRDQFTLNDYQFIATILARSKSHIDSILSLVQDPEIRDELLDKKKVFSTFLDSPSQLYVSLYLYFYIVIRKGMLDHGLNNRELTDYVSIALARYIKGNREPLKTLGGNGPILYLSDILPELEKMEKLTKLKAQNELGNYVLIMTGFFNTYLTKREERKGAPNLSYYEDFGRSCFSQLAGTKVAVLENLSQLFETIANSFRELRVCLNHIKDRYLFIDSFRLDGLV